MKFSVIIPIYNAEKTLNRCLDSILPQLSADIEVLLINDGSVDASESICKEYTNKSESIKYFVQENKGVSSARNKGIDNATGDYILFVDSDDIVSEDYFYTISRRIECDHPDLLLFGAKFLNRCNQSMVYRNMNTPYSGVQLAKLFLLLYKQNNIYALWNKAFSRHIFDDKRIRFDTNQNNGEDAVFVFKYILYSKRMTTCENILYYVDESNPYSLSRKRRENLCDEIITATRNMEKYLDESSLEKSCFKVYKRCIAWGHYRGAYACFNDIIKSCKDNTLINKEIRKVCELYITNMVKPAGLACFLISIPVLCKWVNLIKLLFCIKYKIIDYKKPKIF